MPLETIKKFSRTWPSGSGYRWLLLCICVVVPNVAVLNTADANSGCKKNPTLTTDQYARVLEKDPQRFTNPIMKTVPSDLKIVPDNIRYIVIDYTSLNGLPTEGTLTTAGLKYGYRFKASCRVQDTLGSWWVVVGTPGGYLAYVPADKVENAHEYDTRTRKEIEERRRANQH
jgi:hypothetical protein